MKIRYIFLVLIIVLPIIMIVGYFKYHQTVNKEKLIFKIPIVDDGYNNDTIFLTIDLNIPKYYTLKQYIRNESDCITCGDQQYVFYKEPEKETLAEGDSVTIFFFKSKEEGREIDKTLLSITAFKNVFSGEILERTFIGEKICNRKFELDKSIFTESKIINQEYIDNNKKVFVLEYECIECEFIGAKSVSYIVNKNIPISFELSDLTFDNELKKDFYKILQSVKIKVEYKGENVEIKKLIN